MHATPAVTIAVPSYNQGRFLDEALTSIFAQDVPVEVFLMDGGSTDETRDVIAKWAPRLTGWRSERDGGQSASINEGITRGTAPYVCWLNSDDWLLPGGLRLLLNALEEAREHPAAYGRVADYSETTQKMSPVWVEPFSLRRLAVRCIVSQPGTLIRRSVWNAVGGLDETLTMAMDYELWWKITTRFGPLRFVDAECAVNRVHNLTKTNVHRRQHYREAMAIVRQYYGHLPAKWWFYYPYAVWFKQLQNNFRIRGHSS